MDGFLSPVDRPINLGAVYWGFRGLSIGGNVSIGERTAISIGSRLLYRISVGKDVVIGGSAFVTKEIESNSVAYGIPAKKVRYRQAEERYL